MVEMADGQHQASVKANNGQVDTKQIPAEKTEQADFKNSSPPPGGKDDARK